MNRRTETRFQVYSRAQLILLDQPDREWSVSLTDMSGAGFQLLADEHIPPGKKIVVETDAHLMLAETRNSHRRGDRYAIGAQRVHTYPKPDLPDAAGRIAKVQILINDYQLRMRNESAIPTHAEVPPVVEPEIEIEDEVAPDLNADNDVDPFDPQPSVVFHAIPRVGNPAFPKLMIAPSGSIGPMPE